MPWLCSGDYTLKDATPLWNILDIPRNEQAFATWASCVKQELCMNFHTTCTNKAITDELE